MRGLSRTSSSLFGFLASLSFRTGAFLLIPPYFLLPLLYWGDVTCGAESSCAWGAAWVCFIQEKRPGRIWFGKDLGETRLWPLDLWVERLTLSGEEWGLELSKFHRKGLILGRGRGESGAVIPQEP